MGKALRKGRKLAATCHDDSRDSAELLNVKVKRNR